MKKRALGKSGIEVGAMGLGCVTIAKNYAPDDIKNGIDIIRRAYELGVTMFDTAVVYANGENEKLVGRALKDVRDKIVIATKCGIEFSGGDMLKDSTPEGIRKSLEASLCRLNTDYVDLLYIHRVDPNTPIEATADAMEKLCREGKIRSWGIHPEDIITHRFPLSKADEAYKLMASGKCGKVAVVFDGTENM